MSLLCSQGEGLRRGDVWGARTARAPACATGSQHRERSARRTSSRSLAPRAGPPPPPPPGGGGGPPPRGGGGGRRETGPSNERFDCYTQCLGPLGCPNRELLFGWDPGRFVANGLMDPLRPLIPNLCAGRPPEAETSTPLERNGRFALLWFPPPSTRTPKMKHPSRISAVSSPLSLRMVI